MKTCLYVTCHNVVEDEDQDFCTRCRCLLNAVGLCPGVMAAACRRAEQMAALGQHQPYPKSLLAVSDSPRLSP